MGFRLMPNFGQFRFVDATPAKTADVIFNEVAGFSLLSVSKNEMTPSHAEIFGGPSSLFRLQLQTVDRK